MLVYNIRVHKRLGIKDLRNLAAHMDFYWQYILFGLMDMKELVNAGASQQNKINEILNSWYELSKDTQWEAGATLNLDRHDKELYQCDQGNWWINRITALWHEPLSGQTQMQGADLLKNNLYLRSLDFQWEEKNRHLSKEERARAQLIVRKRRLGGTGWNPSPQWNCSAWLQEHLCHIPGYPSSSAGVLCTCQMDG